MPSLDGPPWNQDLDEKKDFFVSFTQVLNPFLWLEIGVRLILFTLKVCEINFMYSLEKPAPVLCKNSRSTLHVWTKTKPQSQTN